MYGNEAQLHNKIRGYFTYLFATQMPDMKIDRDMTEDQKKHYPQNINIHDEGVLIQDLEYSKWVGVMRHHSFHFKVTESGLGEKIFIPEKTTGATKARELGEAAIKCIGNKVKENDGLYKSAMQPEGAAGWLGAMTHYIVDLANPAHLLKQSSEVYSKAYHSWFENQLGALTKWDKAQGGKGGPEVIYFSWDITNIEMAGLIVPIRPDFAVTSMAFKAIEIAFRKDNNHQHIEFEGNNDDNAKNSGLYLSNKENHWNWKEDLDQNGRSGSLHKYFYDKVEELLCWATFYTACAMQYCMNEGKKESSDTNGLNPDYWVNRDPNDVPRYPPDPDPQRSLDDFMGDTQFLIDKLSKIIRNLGILITPIILGIASLLGRVFFMLGK